MSFKVTIREREVTGVPRIIIGALFMGLIVSVPALAVYGLIRLVFG